MIEIKQLNKSFDNLHVLKDVNATIKEGSVVAIIGPSGSGKSTLLRSLNLLDKPNRGEIIYNNNNILDFNVDEINKYRSEVGMVFQQFNLFNNKTIIDNIILAPTLLKSLSKEDAIKKAESLLKRIDLLDMLLWGTLYGGMLFMAVKGELRGHCPVRI